MKHQHVQNCVLKCYAAAVLLSVNNEISISVIFPKHPRVPTSHNKFLLPCCIAHTGGG